VRSLQYQGLVTIQTFSRSIKISYLLLLAQRIGAFIRICYTRSLCFVFDSTHFGSSRRPTFCSCPLRYIERVDCRKGNGFPPSLKVPSRMQRMTAWWPQHRELSRISWRRPSLRRSRQSVTRINCENTRASCFSTGGLSTPKWYFRGRLGREFRA
jgi:hypothetical protein